MEKDLRTKTEIERDNRDMEIVTKYKEMVKKNQGFKPNRYIIELMKDYSLSNVQIRTILRKNGII